MTDKATPSPEALVEALAAQWDGCEYDAPGGLIDIGDAIRRAGLPLANNLRAEVERLAAQAAPTEAEYNPLLIDGVQHDPLCLKVYRSPLKECDCGASSRAAQPSQAPVVQSNLEAIRGAVARGWCHPKNSHKAMDSDLALAIADEVSAINAAPVVQAVQPTQAVRMLTDDEQAAIIDMHSTGRAQGDHECAEDIQHKFAEVNGLRIPADGKIGSAA